MGGKRQASEIVCEDTSVVNFFGEPNRPSENQENDVVLKKRISRPHREEETSMIWPNICEDKQGFAKYSWQKLPEMYEDKRHLTLNMSELLPKMYDNHQYLLIVTNIWPSVTNI